MNQQNLSVVESKNPEEKEIEFVFVSDACELAGIGCGGGLETMERALKKVGIAPSAYIKGTRGGKEVYARPIYRLKDINFKLAKITRLREQQAAIQAQLAELGVK